MVNIQVENEAFCGLNPSNLAKPSRKPRPSGPAPYVHPGCRKVTLTVKLWHKLFIEFRKCLPVVNGNLLFILARADIKHLRFHVSGLTFAIDLYDSAAFSLQRKFYPTKSKTSLNEEIGVSIPIVFIQKIYYFIRNVNLHRMHPHFAGRRSVHDCCRRRRTGNPALHFKSFQRQMIDARVGFFTPATQEKTTVSKKRLDRHIFPKTTVSEAQSLD